MVSTTLIIGIVVFAVLIIISLIAIIVYMLFFKKVTTIIFGSNGMPNEIRKAKKRKNRLDFGKGINVDIVNNYITQGKKRIYFAQKIDERTFIPFSFVNDVEAIKEIEIAFNNSNEEKEFNKKLKLNFSKKYINLLNQIEEVNKKIDFAKNRILEETEKIDSDDRTFLFINRVFFINNFERNLRLLNLKLGRLKKKEESLRKLEEKKIANLGKSEKKKSNYTVLGKVDVNYNILNGIADSYEEGAIRFKFGLEKFAPFITIAIVAMVCVIGTVMTMKYATSITPVEAAAMEDLGDSMKVCAQYVSTSQQTNLELAKTLVPKDKSEDTPK